MEVLVDPCGRTCTRPRPRNFEGVPLADANCHPASVHLSWPAGVLRSLGSITSARKSPSAAFIRRFLNFQCPSWLPESLLQAAHPAGFARRATDASPKRVLWLVLPWHPMLDTALLRKRLLGLYSSPIHQQAIAFGLGDAPSVRVAWSNS